MNIGFAYIYCICFVGKVEPWVLQKVPIFNIKEIFAIKIAVCHPTFKRYEATENKKIVFNRKVNSSVKRNYNMINFAP